MQASQKPVIWTVVIVGIVLLLAGFWMVSSLKASNAETASALNAKVDTAVATVSNLQFPTASGDTVVQVDPSLCDNIDGCGGLWDVPNWARNPLANYALVELTENNYRDLFDYIESQVDVDDRDDIVSASVYKIGEVRVNTDPDHLETESTVYAEFLIKVEFYEDGSSDTKDKYFLVNAELEDFDDGFSGADVTINSVELSNKRAVL